MHIRWRGLELPSVVNCEAESLTPTYGKFFAEPFERGFGATIGNSLRRILLSSLEGSAVTQIKIRGAQHEFTTVEGILEDVADIVLNVKSLVVKKHTSETRVITIEKSSEGPITGADVQTERRRRRGRQRPCYRDAHLRRAFLYGDGGRKMDADTFQRPNTVRPSMRSV